MLAFSVPPESLRNRPPVRPKLDPNLGIIDRILEEDKLQSAKQGYTATDFRAAVDEYGYGGRVAIVRA